MTRAAVLVAAARPRVYECRCKRRGPVSPACPLVVIGRGATPTAAKRVALASVPHECWTGGATYGHCSCRRIA